MRLIQYLDASGERRVGFAADAQTVRPLRGFTSTYELALRAIAEGKKLDDMVAALHDDATVDYQALIDEKRVLTPVDHPDPAHLLVTGTGLTHLGSAGARDAMHAKLNADEASMTDSMKMFRLGVENGKPPSGETGVQPEWFYKGDGACVAPPEGELTSPAFALDGGEEPEIAGVYVIGQDGSPYRLGFALGNEFSDHKTERINYLYLAHSKLRPCSIGPELLTGDLPDNLCGASRIRREGKVVWEKEFLSGEDNMCHSVANLEAHHFKYANFLRPNDVHIHFFGTATVSFADGFETMAGDVFEIECPDFGRPLRNVLGQSAAAAAGPVRQL